MKPLESCGYDYASGAWYAGNDYDRTIYPACPHREKPDEWQGPCPLCNQEKKMTREDTPQFIIIAAPNFDKKDVPRDKLSSVKVGVCRKCGSYVTSPNDWNIENESRVMGLPIGFLCFACLELNREDQSVGEADSDKIVMTRKDLAGLLREVSTPSEVKELEETNGD